MVQYSGEEQKNTGIFTRLVGVCRTQEFLRSGEHWFIPNLLSSFPPIYCQWRFILGKPNRIPEGKRAQKWRMDSGDKEKILSTCAKHISKCLPAAAFMTLLRPDYLFLLPPSTHFSFHLLHKTLLIPLHKTLASQDPPCRKCVINTFLPFLLSVNQFLDD